MHELMDTPNRSRRAALIAAHVGLGVVFFGALALLFGYVVMALWNGVVADVLAVRKLSYWQGVGLLVLFRVLVGGLHTGHNSHGHHKTAAEQRRDSALDRFVEHGKNTGHD
jgi:hypothetical protein